MTLRFLLAVLVLLSAIRPAQAQSFGTDLHGDPVHDLAGPGTRLVVLFFAATDCPISNRYAPEIARLQQEFSTQGVRIWWVYPNPADTASIVAQHRHAYGITADAVLDTKQSLVALAHVGVTPESAVFAVEGNQLRELYHGRIDDRYISLGQERPQPTHHDLELAIAAALAGKPIPQPQGPPVGCSVVFLQK
jgi:AhpC/TSA family